MKLSHTFAHCTNKKRVEIKFIDDHKFRFHFDQKIQEGSYVELRALRILNISTKLLLLNHSQLVSVRFFFLTTKWKIQILHATLASSGINVSLARLSRLLKKLSSVHLSSNRIEINLICMRTTEQKVWSNEEELKRKTALFGLVLLARSSFHTNISTPLSIAPSLCTPPNRPCSSMLLLLLLLLFSVSRNP